MAKYQYARWVSDKMKHTPKELQSERRGAYFSNSGKVAHYDEYAKWCRLWGYDYDDSPEGYWDSKTKVWHKPAGILMGLSGVLMWLVASIVSGSTGQRRQ